MAIEDEKLLQQLPEIAEPAPHLTIRTVRLPSGYSPGLIVVSHYLWSDDPICAESNSL